LVLLAIRPDCTISALQDLISAKLGPQFLEPPPFDIEKFFTDSTSVTPLIFVLSSGADPMAELQRLSSKLGMNEKQLSVSLGQGQEKKAKKAIEDGKQEGLWVILQNCHLAPSWMDTLEAMVEDLQPDKVHETFRLWLTSMPASNFPVSVLQNGLKMTNEPPKGLKLNLLRGYLSFDPEWFEDTCNKSEACQHAFRKMLFGLCFFHALIQERCKYGPLGWNIPYQFSEPDRQICISQLAMFLEENDAIPYVALRYTAAEANYGGRVTDEYDRRAINHILTDFYCVEILKEDYRFSPSGTYYAPAFSKLETYIEYIRQLPVNQNPEAFGLHANANLSANINEAMTLLQVANSLQPRSGGGESKQNDMVLLQTSSRFLSELPEPFDTEAVEAKYGILYAESMNTVLNQELLRFNKLIVKIRSTLADVGKAVKGLVVMGGEIEVVANGILQNVTPQVWLRFSYPSLKPLISYIADLTMRTQFFQDWIDCGVPNSFWLAGFYFTQSFLTGQKQNHARRFKIVIDALTWNFKVLNTTSRPTIKPDLGCLVYGLFMDGARWDGSEGVIGDSLPKVLFSEIPPIHLYPIEVSKDMTDKRFFYGAPLYRTSERKGTLSTTGHSTNFVLHMWLPISKQHTEKHWVKCGVACLLALDD